jgi:imidazolonepropionase-like amidohydrolase
MMQRVRWLPAIAAAVLSACGSPPESHTKAFLGAVLIDGAGGPPLSNSIVLTAGDRIRAVGARSAVPIPADADRIDGSGKCIVPQPVDACDGAAAASLLRPATAEEGRQRIAEIVGRKAVVQLGRVPPEIAEAVLEVAREANVRVLGHLQTLAEARFLVDHGVSGCIGMITDTTDLDPAFLAHLRDLRVAFAPVLVGAGPSLAVAKQNTKRLFDAGAPIAAATRGADLQRELELLVEAGLPPLDAIVAGTRNSATLLGRGDDTGTIAPEKRADLLVVSANPGEDIRNLRKVALRLSGGEWVK